MTPYFQDDSVTIYHADAREIVHTLGAFDLMLTDPPYGIGYNATALNLPDATERKRIQGDDDCVLAEWLFTVSNASEMLVWGANNFPQLLPHKGVWVCWDKRLTREADRMLGSAFELGWMNRKRGHHKMFRCLHGGVVNHNKGKREHPTEKPIGLLREILETLYPKAQIILDPFGGVGTTARAAKDAGRKCVTIEIEEEYCEAAARRMQQSVLL